MAQGEFTKEEAKATEEAFDEVFKALPKRKQGEYLDTPTTSSCSCCLQARVPEREEMTAYRTIIADPPWQPVMALINGPASGVGAPKASPQRHYATMSVQDIAALRVPGRREKPTCGYGCLASISTGLTPWRGLGISSRYKP